MSAVLKLRRGNCTEFLQVSNSLDTSEFFFNSQNCDLWIGTGIGCQPILIGGSITNYYSTNVSFDTDSGVLTISGVGMDAISSSLDGRFLPTGSFNIFSSSYISDSSSFDERIKSLSSGIGNDYVSGAVFNTNTGIITFDRTGSSNLPDLTVDLDGRWVETGSFDTFVSTIESFTSSYYGDSSSFDTRIDNINQATSSFLQNNSNDVSLTGSFTGSFIGDGSELTGIPYVVSSSFDASTGLVAFTTIDGDIFYSNTFDGRYLREVKFNLFTSSFDIVSSSFDTRIESISSSVNTSIVNTSSLLTITEFNSFTESNTTIIENISGSVYNTVTNLTQEQNELNLQYLTLFNAINNITFNSGALADWNETLFNIPSGLISGFQQIENLGFITESVDISLFNTFTQSYYTDSSSFYQNIDNLKVWSASLTFASDNFYVTGTNFDDTTGELNIFVSGAPDVSTSLDGRYQLSGSYLTELPDGLVSSSQQITDFGFISESVDISLLNLFTQSIHNFTQSYYTDSGSFYQNIDNLKVWSASQTFASDNFYVTGTNFDSNTETLTIFISGAEDVSTSFAGIYQLSGSYLTELPVGLVSGAEQIANDISGAFAEPSAGFDDRLNTLESLGDNNFYPTDLQFDSESGELTLSGSGMGILSTSFDGIYQLSGSYLTELPIGLVSSSQQITAFGFISESVDISLFNTFTQSYYTDSSSFYQNIDNLKVWSASLTFASDNFYVTGTNFDDTTGKLNIFVSGAPDVSTSLDGRYQLSGSYLTELPIGLVSSSQQITNFGFISESVDISLLNLFTQSIHNFTQSYYIDSSSVSISIDLINNFTQSYYNDSSSFNERIDNVEVLASGGTVTSVGLDVPLGMAVSGTPISGSGSITLGLESGYSIPRIDSQSNWDNAYSWGDHSQQCYANQSSLYDNWILNVLGVRDGIIIGSGNNLNFTNLDDGITLSWSDEVNTLGWGLDTGSLHFTNAVNSHINNCTITFTKSSGIRFLENNEDVSSLTFNLNQNSNSSIVISHADTSNLTTGAQGSAGIASITVDDLGHVTAVTTAIYCTTDTNTTYTATQMLTCIKNVDGANSGLDADLLDGQHGSYYLDYNNFTNKPTIPTDNNQLNNGAGYCKTDTTYTANDMLTCIKTVDGAGSGLDADTLDGLQFYQFLRSDVDNAVNSYTTKIQFPSNIDIESGAGDNASLEVYQSSAGSDAFMAFHVGGDFAAYFGLDGSTNDFAVGGWSMGSNKYKVWHAGNDGAGSGLDADTLDGKQASAFYLATNPSGYTTCTGDITAVYTCCGLRGGGNSGNIFLNIDAGDGISVGVSSVGVDSTVLRTTGCGVVSGSSQIDAQSASNPSAIYDNGGTPALRNGITAAEVRNLIGVDASGTDNSTAVTLDGSYDYITISGQVITRNQITNEDLAGNIDNNKLVNSSITISGTSVSLGGSITDEILFGGTGIVSSSVQVNADSITNFDSNVKDKMNSDGVISGSSQVNADSITNFDSNVKDKMNSDGVISGSAQLGDLDLCTVTQNGCATCECVCLQGGFRAGGGTVFIAGSGNTCTTAIGSDGGQLCVFVENNGCISFGNRHLAANSSISIDSSNKTNGFRIFGLGCDASATYVLTIQNPATTVTPNVGCCAVVKYTPVFDLLSGITSDIVCGNCNSGNLILANGNQTTVSGSANLTFNETNNILSVGGVTVGRGACNAGTNLAIGDSTTLQSNYCSDGCNLAIGAGVLKLNTTGCCNVGIGYSALFYNSTSSNNTAIGHGSMAGTATNAANQNTAIGAGTLGNITCGGGNVAIGYLSGGVTSGCCNIAIGLATGVCLGNQSSTIAIGNGWALPTNHTGIGNPNTSCTCIYGSTCIFGKLEASGDIIAFQSSDQRLKNNIQPIEDSLSKLNKINGVTFDWNLESDLSGSDVGVIAQEVQEILPQIVTERDNGYLAVRYDKLIPLLIESNKELLKRIQVLEEKIEKQGLL